MSPPQRGPGRPAGSTTAATKAALLRAAREVFAEHGYAGAAIGDIVARAGVTPPVLYHHFSSKAGLYAAAAREVYGTVVDGLERAVAGRTTFAGCVEAILLESARMHAADPSMAAFIVSAPVVVDTYPELAVLAPETEPLQGLFARIVDRTGGVPGQSRESSIRVLRIFSGGMTRLSAGLPDPDSFRSAVEALRAIAVEGVLVAPESPGSSKPRPIGSQPGEAPC